MTTGGSLRFAQAIALNVSLFVLASVGTADTVEKKSSEGKLRLRYTVDAEGNRHGLYEEFHPSGKLKVKAYYKDDLLDGSFKSYHDNGKPHVTATYRAGQLEGSYVEESDKGGRVLTAHYKEGKLNGVLTRYDKGVPVMTQAFQADMPIYSRSLEQIKKQLTAIAQALPVPGAKDDEEVVEAVRRLQAYRYLAEVPYANLEIDETYTHKAQAAAKICERLGQISHNPSNPGLAEAEYKVALEGARNSLLAFNLTRLAQSVDVWMHDSDPANIEMLGHRRACLSPWLRKIGFGRSGKFHALWSNDASQSNVADFDIICYPARGLMPVEFLTSAYAWNVSLNPSKFSVPTPDVTPRVFAVDQTLNKLGAALPLNFSAVVGDNLTRPIPAVIFRPSKIAIEPGRRYLVEIEGLKRPDGKTPAPVAYLVEFVTLK